MSDDYRVREAIKEGHLRVVAVKDNGKLVSNIGEIWGIFEPLLCLATPQQGRLLYLRFRRGLTIKEAAREMGVAPCTAHNHLSRFADRVRVYLRKNQHN